MHVPHGSSQPIFALGQATPVAYLQQPSHYTVHTGPITGLTSKDSLAVTVELNIDNTTTVIELVLYPEGDLDVYRDGQPALIRPTDEQTLHAYEHIRQQIADTGQIF